MGGWGCFGHEQPNEGSRSQDEANRDQLDVIVLFEHLFMLYLLHFIIARSAFGDPPSNTWSDILFVEIYFDDKDTKRKARESNKM